MLYQCNITIPADTPQVNPERQSFMVTRGTINKVMVGFPPGCNGLASVIIRHHEHQLFPSSPDVDLAWDNYIFVWDEDLIVTEEPFQLTVEGWNRDTLYEHTITVWVNMLSNRGGIAEYVKRLIGF